MNCDMSGHVANVARDYETSTAQLYCNGMITEAQGCAHLLRTMSALPQLSKAATSHRLEPRPARYIRQLWSAQVQLTARLVKALSNFILQNCHQLASEFAELARTMSENA